MIVFTIAKWVRLAWSHDHAKVNLAGGIICLLHRIVSLLLLRTIIRTISTGEPGHAYKSVAVHKNMKIKQSVNKSCRENEFIDESMFYHTVQQLSIFQFLLHLATGSAIIGFCVSHLAQILIVPNWYTFLLLVQSGKSFVFKFTVWDPPV